MRTLGNSVVLLALLILVLGQGAVYPSIARGQPDSTESKKSNQLRLELGASSPVGLIGVRYSRELETHTRIEPGIGMGYTGIVTSILVTQPFLRWKTLTPSKTRIAKSLEGYV